MLRKARRFVCLLMALVLPMLSILPTAANAASISDEKQLPTEQVLYTFSGKDCAPKLVNRMEGYGVKVKSDTLFQLVKLNADEEPTALLVTNKDDNQVSQSLFKVLDESGDAVSFPVPASSASGQTRGIDEAYAYSMDNIFSNGSFVFRWIILYDRYLSAGGSQYFRPKHIQFTCFYDYSYNYSVTDVCVKLITTGTECDSNFNFINNVYDFRYEILLERTVAARNTTYSTTDPYNANRWICTNGDLGTFIVDVSFDLNGRTYANDFDVENLLLNE